LGWWYAPVIPQLFRRWRQEDQEIKSLRSGSQSIRPYLKNKNRKARSVDQVVEHLLREALSSNPGTANKQTKKGMTAPGWRKVRAGQPASRGSRRGLEPTLTQELEREASWAKSPG
jgi:hypothetical protein